MNASVFFSTADKKFAISIEIPVFWFFIINLNGSIRCGTGRNGWREDFFFNWVSWCFKMFLHNRVHHHGVVRNGNINRLRSTVDFSGVVNLPELTKAAEEWRLVPWTVVGHTSIPLIGCKVGSDDDTRTVELNGATFGFNLVRMTVENVEKFSEGEHRAGELVKDDSVLVVVAVPPLIVGLPISVRCNPSCMHGLASSSWANKDDNLRWSVAFRLNKVAVRKDAFVVADEVSKLMVGNITKGGARINEGSNLVQVVASALATRKFPFFGDNSVLGAVITVDLGTLSSNFKMGGGQYTFERIKTNWRVELQIPLQMRGTVVAYFFAEKHVGTMFAEITHDRDKIIVVEGKGPAAGLCVGVLKK